MKRCSICCELKSSEEYYRDKRGRDGYAAACKDCRKKKQQTFLQNPIRLREHNARIMRWRKCHPEKVLWIAAKQRAKKFSIPFSIQVSDIIIPNLCPILNIPLISNVGKICGTSPTLDRIVPTLGYVPGNIAVISARANTIKHNATSDELMKVAKWLEMQEIK